MENKGARCSCTKPQSSSCHPRYPHSGYLMHKIIGQGQLYDRDKDICICLETLPYGACPPFHLESITSCNHFSCRMDHDRIIVTVPLQCFIKDCRGSTFASESTVDFTVPIRCLTEQKHPACACIASGNICLNHCVCSNNACFHANVTLCLNAYVTTPEVLMSSVCSPACPPSLPWYPQPNKRHL